MIHRNGSVEVFYRIQKMLREDFQAIFPGGSYPFTRETFLHILLYAGFILFILQLFLYPKYISCKSPMEYIEKDSFSSGDATEI